MNALLRTIALVLPDQLFEEIEPEIQGSKKIIQQEPIVMKYIGLKNGCQDLNSTGEMKSRGADRAWPVGVGHISRGVTVA